MHPEAFEVMKALCRRAPGGVSWVLDVGSLDVNGTYRALMEQWPGARYVGCDIQRGRNVTVQVSEERYPFRDEQFDVVLCGSTLEHTRRPWRLIPELARVLRRGGLLAIVTHWRFPYHAYPIDTFRFLPDGLRALFDEAGGALERYECHLFENGDSVGSALRR